MTVKEKANALLPPNASLLYLTETGSGLFGLQTPTSDHDYKGIYLPRIDSVILGNVQHTITYTTGSSTGKNTSDDIDLTLISVQQFLKLLRNGDTSAVDLLFSLYHEESTISVTPSFLQQMKDNKDRLISKASASYLGYAMGQASKYGIKGSRYGDLKALVAHVDLVTNPEVTSDILPIPKLKYVSELTLKGRHYISVLGKLHEVTIPFSEFRERLNTQLAAYGDRTKASVKGVDWKALSHAYRILIEFTELVQIGYITFPLKRRSEILEIKTNTSDDTLDYHLNILGTLIDELEVAIKDSDLPDRVDPAFIDSLILSYYK